VVGALAKKATIMSSSAPVEPNPETPTSRRIGNGLDRAPQARRLSSVARRATIAAAACIVLAMPFSPARAGFFDFLFPPAQPAMPAYRPPPHFFHHRISHVEHHKKKVAARLWRGTAEAKHLAAPGAVDVMDDDSLRDGDAVMTADGLRIFIGSEGRHHMQGDFVSVSETGGLSGRERSALLAVVGGREGGQSALVTGRSAAEPGLSAGVPIVDPRGARIRYVGP
jgi:hypothetical protein